MKGYRNVVCIYVVLILVISIIRQKRSCVLEEAELLILDKLIAGIASNQFRWRWTKSGDDEVAEIEIVRTSTNELKRTIRELGSF